MSTDTRYAHPRFPKASAYHPDWVAAGIGSAANALGLTEWLTEAMTLRPGMRVLDLGCGRGLSSVFLRREFGAEVWAADLWFHPTENARRFEDAGVADGVFPLRADARTLPFADDFFDAVVSVDSFFYYGTDDLYLNYLMRFLKPGGQLGIAGAGLTAEFDEPPEYMRAWWTPATRCQHTADWWRRHWERRGVVDVELADTMPDGWQLWLDWLRQTAPDNHDERQVVEADAGRHIGYVRAVARRRADVVLDDLVVTFPPQYAKQPLLRTARGSS